MKKLLLGFGLLFLFAVEILRIYFIMPFPGSQKQESIGIAYFLNQYIWLFRLAGIAMLVAGSWKRFGNWRPWQKILWVTAIVLYGFIFYAVKFVLSADKMFYQPRHKSFAAAGAGKVPASALVLGVVINDEAKAYPLEIIGYHHQVRDTIAGTEVMVTYCTVCRTGRVYSPMVDGKLESFRLVGMDHFNAMFEDKTTKSWWRQVNGEAIAGPKKGSRLKEIPSAQMSLQAWLRQYPNTNVLQADPDFEKQYKGLAGFDKGTIEGSLEHRDSSSWAMKSWVVGIATPQQERAYDWNELLQKKLVNDSLPGLPLVIMMESDSSNFHVWNRALKDMVLSFVPGNGNTIVDQKSGSTWNADGICTDGPLKGEKLEPVQAYQEFWHSWHSFHPATTKYTLNR